jgi:hypothetical protein
MVSVGIYGVGFLLYTLMVKVASAIMDGRLRATPGAVAQAQEADPARA